MNAGTKQRDPMAAYQQPVKEVLAALHTDGTNGLVPWMPGRDSNDTAGTSSRRTIRFQHGDGS